MTNFALMTKQVLELTGAGMIGLNFGLLRYPCTTSIRCIRDDDILITLLGNFGA